MVSDIRSSAPNDAINALLRSMASPSPRSMSKRARETRVLAHIRQLCALGLPSRAVIPHIIRSLDEVIGSDIAGFHWSADDGSVADVYANEPQLLRAASEYHHRSDHSTRGHLDAYGIDFPTAMRRGRGWGNTARLAPTFERSIEFDALWRPFGLKHGVERTCALGGRGRGALVLLRHHDAGRFGGREELLLASVSEHIAHAVMAPERPVREFTDSGDSGLIIADAKGRLVSFSERGRQLLESSTRDRLVGQWSATLPEWLRALARRHRIGTNSPPAFVQRTTAWGRFSFRAYRLDPFSDGNLVAIYVTRLEPMRLNVARGAIRLGLTPRQSEICALLAEGLSHAEIATRLDIRASTVVDHLRKAYSMCDVHDHASLVMLIGAAARQGP